jgi:hypothetical protein
MESPVIACRSDARYSRARIPGSSKVWKDSHFGRLIQSEYKPTSPPSGIATIIGDRRLSRSTSVDRVQAS